MKNANRTAKELAAILQMHNLHVHNTFAFSANGARRSMHHPLVSTEFGMVDMGDVLASQITTILALQNGHVVDRKAHDLIHSSQNKWPH